MNLNPIVIAGREILPVIEGGKGINVSTGLTSGIWASMGGMGTFSGVNPDFYGKDGRYEKPEFCGQTREARQKELIDYGIRGCLDQAGIAHEESNGRGMIAMNILWEQGGSQPLLEGALSRAKGIIKSISCGAGMPFRLADIAARHKVFYNPIISSVRVLQLLWKRSFSRFKEWIGAVIYEDPWLAGGHNGLSNSENPLEPQKPFSRVLEIRRFMNEVGLKTVPIIVAGGIWWLSEWTDYMNNPDLGPIGFQFGSRPMVTVESPLGDNIKKKLMNAERGSVKLQKFSPTGLYSSAVHNAFLRDLEDALTRQIPFVEISDKGIGFDLPVELSATGKTVYISQGDKGRMAEYLATGYDKMLKTPSNTLLFVPERKYNVIMGDWKNCVGCLSGCLFSGWSQRGTPGQADPRSFCIQRSLQEISHGNDAENSLLFSGQIVWRFKEDPFYQNGAFIPTVRQLFERILTGY
ncbi:MAG: nitronate monooxygenase [Rickettsiales bacterium]|jgi:NAD(P)H-dependent flavin oxidoreductase YrpB (nitropropane dioxygenase family)|nr:nitronate monooxygenase [Rickettsiales bacterium]